MTREERLRGISVNRHVQEHPAGADALEMHVIRKKFLSEEVAEETFSQTGLRNRCFYPMLVSNRIIAGYNHERP